MWRLGRRRPNMYVREETQRVPTLIRRAARSIVRSGIPLTDTPAASPATSTPSSPDVSVQNSRTLAAVAYVLTFITGIIIFLVAKEDKYARWHAIQAIGLGVFALVVGIVLGFLPFLGMLSLLWNLAVLVAVIFLAVKAYQGEKVRLPVVADMADKNA